MLHTQIGPNQSMTLLLQHHADKLLANFDNDRPLLDRWLPWTTVISNHDAATAFIVRYLRKLADSDGILFGIWSDEKLAGGILLRTIDWSARRTEIGYWIGTPYQGRGLATKATSRLVDFVFHELDLEHVTLQISPHNTASCAVGERLGFQKEGVLRHAYVYPDGVHDHVFYGMLKSEWSSRCESFSD